jgi:hypothetical protein
MLWSKQAKEAAAHDVEKHGARQVPHVQSPQLRMRPDHSGLGAQIALTGLASKWRRVKTQLICTPTSQGLFSYVMYF